MSGSTSWIGKAREAAAACPSGEAVQAFEFRFAVLRDEILVELQEIEPKAAKLHEKLASLELLIQRLPSRTQQADLRPTHEEFSERLSNIVAAAIENQHPKLQEAGSAEDRAGAGDGHGSLD